MTVTIERRYATLTDVEVRDTDTGGLSFSGHAAVFNSPTDIGPFREQVAPGAFKATIKPDRTDVRLLFNHNPDSVMARTTNGSLALSEDATGLLAEADLDPSDVDVQRLLPKLRSGNVSQMSFGFRVIKDDWSEPDDDGRQLRTLKEVQLFDVSAVTFPAYDDTDVALNSIARGALEVAEARGIVCEQDAEQVAAHIRESLAPHVSDDKDSPEARETQDPPVSQEAQALEADPDPAAQPVPSPSRLSRKKRLDYLKSTL